MCVDVNTIHSVCAHAQVDRNVRKIEHAPHMELPLGWECKDNYQRDYGAQHHNHDEHFLRRLREALCGHKQPAPVTPLSACRPLGTFTIIHGFCSNCSSVFRELDPYINHQKFIPASWLFKSLEKGSKPFPAEDISPADLHKTKDDCPGEATARKCAEVLTIAEEIKGFCDLRPGLQEPDEVIEYLLNIRDGELACAASLAPPERQSPPMMYAPTAALAMASGSSNLVDRPEQPSSPVEAEPEWQQDYNRVKTYEKLTGERLVGELSGIMRRRDRILSFRLAAKASDPSILHGQDGIGGNISEQESADTLALKPAQSNRPALTQHKSRFTDSDCSIADAHADVDVNAYEPSTASSRQSSCFDEDSASSAASTRSSTPSSIDFSAFAKEGEDGDIYLVPGESPLPAMGRIVKEVLPPAQIGQTSERAAKKYIAEGCAQRYCRQFGVAQPPELF
jgi:hypothetical protein